MHFQKLFYCQNYCVPSSLVEKLKFRIFTQTMLKFRFGVNIGGVFI